MTAPGASGNERDAAIVASLPAAWYHDPATFEREQSAIFARHWLLAARAEQLNNAGDFVAAEAAGRPILVLRDQDGALRAFHNVCRHRAGPLVEEAAGTRATLRCRYHGWTYALDGRLKAAPGFPAREEMRACDVDLFALRVAAWNGLVFVCLDPKAPDLESWLGDIPGIARDFPALDQLVFAGSDETEGHADWKAYSDNAAEGYHLPHVHKALNKALLRPETKIAAYENGQFVGFQVRYKAAANKPESRGFWIYKFPGLLLHFSEYGFNLERILPLGPGRLQLTRWFWFPPGDAETHRALIAESAVVMREDLAICEAVQRNLEAGIYAGGLLSSEREPGTVFFQKLVREALGGERSGGGGT